MKSSPVGRRRMRWDAFFRFRTIFNGTCDSGSYQPFESSKLLKELTKSLKMTRQKTRCKFRIRKISRRRRYLMNLLRKINLRKGLRIQSKLGNQNLEIDFDRSPIIAGSEDLETGNHRSPRGNQNLEIDFDRSPIR